MDKYTKDSKSIVALDKKSNKVKLIENADTSLLNQNSVNDLQAIKSKMVSDKIKIDDLQFLTSEDGHVVIADPLNVYTKTKPSNNNIKMIDLLIEQSKNK